MLPHVLFEQACVIEGIVAFQVKLVRPAVEACGGAVTEDGGVRASAVGGLVLSHGVATVPTVPTSLI